MSRCTTIPAEHSTKTKDSCASPTQAEAPVQVWELVCQNTSVKTNLNFSTGSLVLSIAFFAFSTIIDSFRSPAVFGRDIVGSNKILNSESIWLLEINRMKVLPGNKGNVVKSQIILAVHIRAFQSKPMFLIFWHKKWVENGQRIKMN